MPKKISPEGKVKVSVAVRSVGGRLGDEVVRLYVNDVVQLIAGHYSASSSFYRCLERMEDEPF